ncbi:hypothetical protein [Mangrovibacter plantisponsor]|uniref:Uncharacterized protein n=1 Tax=Mangrovibacter plantisponsor TaxID=451513 RepID=A0A317PTA5_9ENTR|nr:hypothetical protein [Mangrovibacter plantisponsor]PWW04912.1 hypothetical protein DES37_1142 [Mangrovibacter plantisponsor]
MPVDLKKIPDVSCRPKMPEIKRWLVLFSFLVIVYVFILYFFTNLVGSFYFILVPAFFVFSGFYFVFFVFSLKHVSANAWDKQREAVILQEVRRGRRSLQILAAEYCTAHSFIDTPFTPAINNLLNNENVLFPQCSWRGEDNIRLSQLARSEGRDEEHHISVLFAELAKKIAIPLSQLPGSNPVMLLFEASSSIADDKLDNLWSQAWQAVGIQQSYTSINGSGPKVIDDWLDNNIRSKAVLLIIGLQYVPEHTAMSAEVISGILLGNRLTQQKIHPLAIIHRPELVLKNTDYQNNMITQALDWVPVNADKLKHLWISGVLGGTDECQVLMHSLENELLTEIDRKKGIHNFSDFIGGPGKASMSLAIAAATQSVNQKPEYHFLIIQESASANIWGMVISPCFITKDST